LWPKMPETKQRASPGHSSKALQQPGVGPPKATIRISSTAVAVFSLILLSSPLPRSRYVTPPEHTCGSEVGEVRSLELRGASGIGREERALPSSRQRAKPDEGSPLEKVMLSTIAHEAPFDQREFPEAIRVQRKAQCGSAGEIPPPAAFGMTRRCRHPDRGRSPTRDRPWRK